MNPQATVLRLGEVVERPSSVVKELLENALDAGATSISIEIANGGLSLIRIADNGSGIHPDDLPLAFMRHATGKIRSEKFLMAIETMGFRGEALSSIAAVSRVALSSRQKGCDSWLLHFPRRWNDHRPGAGGMSGGNEYNGKGFILQYTRQTGSL